MRLWSVDTFALNVLLCSGETVNLLVWLTILFNPVALDTVLGPCLDTMWNYLKCLFKFQVKWLLNKQALPHLIYLVRWHTYYHIPYLWSFDLCYCEPRKSVIKYFYLLSRCGYFVVPLLYLIIIQNTILYLSLKNLYMLLKFLTIFYRIIVLLFLPCGSVLPKWCF